MADQLENESAAALLTFKNGGLGYGDIKQEVDEELMDVDHEETTILGPAALGLQRVGEELPPRPSPAQPGLVLNRRGMPARIRKKNRLFFDDDVVNTMLPRSKNRGVRGSPNKKNSATANKISSSQMKKQQVQQQLLQLPELTAAPTSEQHENSNMGVVGSPDRRTGQRIGMRLRNLLKLPKAHKWVCYEWFYSNIDKCHEQKMSGMKYPNNMKKYGTFPINCLGPLDGKYVEYRPPRPLFDGDNDFMICLKESFPQIRTRKLTMVEWCRIRRMMGKPRRCSQAFFEEERLELERKRAKIRLLQQRKTADVTNCKDLPGEIPLQLVIGTKVTARLRRPQDGLFTGSIDAVDTSNNTYRITFERPGLGTHSVPDYEVLSNEPPETITVSSFAQKFRPRNVTAFMTPPRYSDPLSPRLNSDPLLGASSVAKMKSVPSDGMLGGFPVKCLDMIVRLSKILNAKKLKINRLRDMNAEAEKRKSYGTYIPEDFQRRYASTIIELERLNKDLQEYLSAVQSYCQEIAPEPSLAAMLEPAHLRERSQQEARDMVERFNSSSGKCMVKNNQMLNLITQLTALMLQVKSLSEADRNAYELKVLQESMEEIRSRLSPQNQQHFQNCVEIHMQHIQMGLGQCGTLHPFMVQRV